MTINVSEFYRDPEQFEVLKSRVLPGLLRRSSRLNIWSAGCSIGAEAYSIAMMLEELTPGRRHQIVATDIDQEVLFRARAGGPYSANELNSLEKKLLFKHFARDGDRYVLDEEMRKRVQFRRHDLLRDSFGQNLDLIICRNVVIYFADEPKDQLNRRFVGALKDGGVLFIGATEALLGAKDLKLTRLFPAFYQKQKGHFADLADQREVTFARS